MAASNLYFLVAWKLYMRNNQLTEGSVYRNTILPWGQLYNPMVRVEPELMREQTQAWDLQLISNRLRLSFVNKQPLTCFSLTKLSILISFAKHYLPIFFSL
jgi:hypothetical protein